MCTLELLFPYRPERISMQWDHRKCFADSSPNSSASSNSIRHLSQIWSYLVCEAHAIRHLVSTTFINCLRGSSCTDNLPVAHIPTTAPHQAVVIRTLTLKAVTAAQTPLTAEFRVAASAINMHKFSCVFCLVHSRILKIWISRTAPMVFVSALSVVATQNSYFFDSIFTT